MIFDKKDELDKVFVTFPKLTGSLQVSIFDCVVFLCALICRRYGLSGEILTKVSSTLNRIGYMTIDADGYTPCDTVAFNFEKVTNLEVFQDIIKEPSRYLTETETEEFMKYFQWITLPETTQEEKVKIFNEMYQNIKGLGYYVGRKLSEAELYPEYRAWKDLYDALFITKETNEMFQLGATGTAATTYAEYLQVMNPQLYDIVTNTDDYLLYSYIDHVIYSLEQVVDNLMTLYIVNDSNSTVHDYLIKLVKFFKSYTTDLIDLTTQYVFDLKPDNLFKLTEYYKMHKVIISSEAYRLMYSDVATIIAYMKQVDEHKFSEFIALSKTIPYKDSMRYIDDIGEPEVARFKTRRSSNADKADISELELSLHKFSSAVLQAMFDVGKDITHLTADITENTVALYAVFESLCMDEFDDNGVVSYVIELVNNVSSKCKVISQELSTTVPIVAWNLVIQEVNKLLDPNTRKKREQIESTGYDDTILCKATMGSDDNLQFTDSVIIL